MALSNDSEGMGRSVNDYFRALYRDEGSCYESVIQFVEREVTDRDDEMSALFEHDR